MSEETKDISIEEKLAWLKNANRYSADDFKDKLNSWEDKITKLRITNDWLNHPNTKELKNILEEQIRMINSILANEEKISNEERLAWIKVKGIVYLLLSPMLINTEKELEHLEKLINYEIT